MTQRVTVYDEPLGGERSEALTLDFLTTRITLRELLRRRVYEEVREYNAAPHRDFRGLIPPLARKLAGGGAPRPQKVEWEPQLDRAVEAFQRGRFLVLVGDRQVTNLDEEIELKLETEVTFVRLVPLVGG